MSDLFVGAGNALQRLQPVAIDEEALEEIKLRAKLQPHFLGEPLVVIAEADDFSHFEIGKDDHCLIALDTLGRVVVVEFRMGVARTADPLLALRYASHIGKLNVEELGKIAHAFISRPANLPIRRGWEDANVEMSDEAVELSSLLATSFDRDAEDFTENINSAQRIIIAAEGFDRRMVEVISWLVNNGADICGLRYRTFMVGGQEIYFAEQVVPQTDPSVDSGVRKSPTPVEMEEPWRVRQLQYYTERLIPSVANQLEELLKIIRSHTFSIDWSHKYYFLVRGARRNLRIRTYQRNRLDIGFFNANVEAVNEFLAAYSLDKFEATAIGGYEKSPFVGTTSDVEFDDRWRAALCDWLSGANPGTTQPELPSKGRKL